jgi:hypothetical protein
MDMLKDLLIIRQGRHEVHYRFVIIIKGMNRIGVGRIDASAFEINTGDPIA